MDDPILVVAGSKLERDRMLSMLLHTASIFGINLSYQKGERGTRLTWIGVSIEIKTAEREIVLTVPDKLIKEVRTKLEEMQGMISLREFKALTGKLSWLAGILPRSRWAVSMLYAVVASVEKDIKLGLEAQRAARRDDQRLKPQLVCRSSDWNCHELGS